MQSERPENFSASKQTEGQTAAPAAPTPATVVVRGETVEDGKPTSVPKDKDRTPPKPVVDAKVRMQHRLPVLDDDAAVGTQRAHVVTRDGKADLSFTGTLLASAAPASAPAGNWQELRVYETDGGKHIFSKISRSVYAEEEDAHEAEVFDPSPSSVPSKLLRGARDLTRAQPLTWMDAAVDFFGYEPLAKSLYQKLGHFEEHIT